VPSVNNEVNTMQLPQRKHLGRIPVKLPTSVCVLYFVTCSNWHRHVLWNSESLVALSLEALTQARENLFCRVPLYCYMPDHVHLVTYPRQRGQSLSRFIQRVKGSTTQRLHKHGIVGTIWQREFFDRLLRSDEDLFEKCRYVRENPVRAGLVESWEQYPYTGSLDDFP
jgi:putative transposase